MRSDEETGIVRLVIGVGGADQDQNAIACIICHRKLKDVIRATFPVTMQKEDDGILDRRIEVLGKQVPIGITGALNVRCLPHRVDRGVTPEKSANVGIGGAYGNLRG